MVQILKLYLLPSSYGKQEIRRITVNHDVANSFSMLTEKIVKHFPILTDKKFSVMWKDEEQDDIIMSSDEELSQAIANVENFMKIYIAIEEDVKPTPEEKGEVFESVICDGCDSKIQGCRYQCLECPDYDLCSKCNYENMHPNHNMMKYCSPNSVPSDFSAYYNGQPDFLRFMNPHGYPWKCPGRKNGERRRFGGRNKGHCKKDFEWDSSANDFLKNVGQSVSNLLHPFGIDVSVDVASPNNMPCGNEQETTCKAESGGKETVVVPDGKTPKPTEADNKTDCMSATEVPPLTSQCSSSFAFARAEPGFKTRGLFIPPPPPPNFYQFGSSAASSESIIKVEKPIPPTAPHNRTYPVIEEKEPVAELVEDSKLATEGIIDFTGMTADIAEKVAAMLEMGFSNNGGWLQRLLESKNGSIPDTLEYLYPNYPRN